MDYQTALARVRGLGSAKKGVGHWWMQRISAIALIPLTFWFVAFLKHTVHADYTQITTWLSQPVNSLCAVSFITAAFYHSALGLQVVMEDYIHDDTYKIPAIWTMKLTLLFLSLAAWLAVLRIILS